MVFNANQQGDLVMKQALMSGAIFLISCGMPLPDNTRGALADLQPRVIEMLPEDGETLDVEQGIQLKFSHPVDSGSILPQSVLMISQWKGGISSSQLLKDISSGATKSVPLKWELSADAMTLHLTPKNPLQEGATAVVVTPALLSQDHMPFNQTPGMGSTPFIGSLMAGVGAGSPGIVTGPTAEDESAYSPGASQASYIKSSPLPLVINEIFYDVPGDDTNGDLFVELRGRSGGDVGGYQIFFINGDDGKETDHITLPAGLVVPQNGLLVIADGITGDLQHTHVANANYLDNFDPQNGPDSVQLISPTGKLVDVLAYGTPKQVTAFNNLSLLEGIAGPDAPAGFSVSRLEDAEDSNNNSIDFVINAKPSPGSYDVEVKL